MGVDCERTTASSHRECRKQRQKPEDVVAVQVRDEYVVDALGVHSSLLERHLRALAAVYQIEFVAEAQQMRGVRSVLERHRRTAA